VCGHDGVLQVQQHAIGAVAGNEQDAKGGGMGAAGLFEVAPG